MQLLIARTINLLIDYKVTIIDCAGKCLTINNCNYKLNTIINCFSKCRTINFGWVKSINNYNCNQLIDNNFNCN